MLIERSMAYVQMSPIPKNFLQILAEVSLDSPESLLGGGSGGGGGGGG